MARTLKPVATSPFDCLGGKCPTIYRTETGSYVVQGLVLDDETRQSLQVPATEEVVEIPAALLDQLLNQIRIP